MEWRRTSECGDAECCGGERGKTGFNEIELNRRE